MAMAKPYLQHLRSSQDLQTTYAAIRAGFIALALEKNRQATPFVAEARALKRAASKAKVPTQLLDIAAIQAALLTAAGISDKAAGYFQQQDRTEAIQGLINNFLEPAGKSFVEELVFRFLLTRGDSLGGSMRNIGGAFAQRKLTRAIISTLKIAGISCHWLHSTNKAWAPMSAEDADIEIYVRGLHWKIGKQERALIYNLKVPVVNKNVDFCLLNGNADELKNPELAKVMYRSPERYIALGELKGGIDPAGADEHWKTARTSLERIRSAFSKTGTTPHTFFIGAAIEKSMAEEIWEHLETGLMENAANLTDENQITSISYWLCNL